MSEWISRNLGKIKLFVDFYLRGNWKFFEKLLKEKLGSLVSMFFLNDTEQPQSDYVGRNFNPLFSHQEDIATGVAAVALAFMLNLKNDNKKE